MRKHRFRFTNGGRGIAVHREPRGIMLIVRDSESNAAKPWRVLKVEFDTAMRGNVLASAVVNPQASLEKAKDALDAWVNSGGTVRS